MKVALRIDIYEADQFVPSENKIPKGVSDVYHMGGDHYTGQIWIAGERHTINPGHWVLYERHGLPTGIVTPDGISDYVKVQIDRPS